MNHAAPFRHFKLFVLATCWGLLPTVIRAENFVDIGVRSKVIDKELQWSHKVAAPDEGGHGKSFAILAVEEIKSAERLVKPVNQQELLRQLFVQLEKNGFHKYAKGTKPEVLLTLSYGRGSLKNPFLENLTTGELIPGSSMLGGHTDLPAAVISGAATQQLVDERTPGFEANLQKADFEKLFLRVTAWEYPQGAKAKPKMLWKTVIVADDPEHRDLNAIAAQMLEAGAAYFDKDIKDDKREINIYKPLPEGHVNVGSPEVVETPAPKSR